MPEGLAEIRAGLGRWTERGTEWVGAIAPLRAATAQVLMATGAAAALARLHGDDLFERRSAPPEALSWAPMLVGPLAAVAQLEHARQPREETGSAVRLLNVAVLAIGGGLVLFDLLRAGRLSRGDVAPLAFASAGLLGVVVDRHEKAAERTEQRLRRRAAVVERLVPRRRPKLDRVVVHV